MRVLSLVLAVAGASSVVAQPTVITAPPAATASSAAPAPTAPPPAASAATPSPSASPLDLNSEVIVLCYHRFEDNPKDSLAIAPADFEAQMQKLKDEGVEVVSMEDFLAWRRGEKSLPKKAAVIGIDDGYLSGYAVAWPILKKFGHPFTMYIYTDYVKGGPKSGGQSMTWEQLAEMRDAGVNIGSHTVSHSPLNARKGRTEVEYAEWVRGELVNSKAMLEEKLGIPIKTLAYPYGLHNEVVRKAAADAGYEAAFTVYGQHMRRDADGIMLGRYAVESSKPAIFAQAVKFGGAPAAAPGAGGVMPAAATMLTQPMEGEVINNPLPELKANLATLGPVDPASVVMRVSGIGVVPAAYDPASKTLSYKMTQRLRAPEVNVFVSANAGGRKVETRWGFRYQTRAE